MLDSTKIRGMQGLAEVTLSIADRADRLVCGFIGLAFVLACIPTEQRALAIRATSHDGGQS